MEIIQINNLTKRFNSLAAVDSVSFSVSEGEIFALLGPNGAGKTTLISMLVTMKKPTSGKASVNGFSIVKNPDDVRRSIGIVFQDQSLDEELTAYENLELHAAMYGVEKKEREARIKEVIRMVELEDRLHAVVKTFSGGMRRRLEIARGLIHYPKVLFLDEPTIGLDPQTRNHIWEYIKKLKKEHGITVLITTHYMDEADSLCDRVAIMDHGKIIAIGKTEDLKNSLGGDSILVETGHAKKLCSLLKDFGCKGKPKAHNGSLTLYVDHGEKKIPKIVELASRKGVHIASIVLHKPTLDDVFLHYTGKTIREEEASTNEGIRGRVRARRMR
ncbi:MAG: ATP-binding cassette domain-containing protein [Candidatus ainarchaeum sp.]|nr:ATP-binding cassette domain-containing protein [Candidatus ainarchaeum sp.]MDD5096408.1 ATP-binding cassette domain-containing protein [Candidatus ainarchaeum sp.]